MKNLKKVTALVIVLAMALSSVAFASFSDVSEDASYNEAVQVMASLGLLVGYEDGTFGPDKTITRAEFAAVIVRALGMEDAAKGASVNTIFTDVPADHWASGYVQIANQQGIILGYGDGNFGPDDEVLYEQAVKMIECALGYGVKFKNVADAYPTSYLAQANADGITVGASGKIGDKASRAVVARLVYNSLDVPMMVQTTIGGNNGDEYQVDDSTSLLYSKLKIAKVEGTVDKLFFNKEQADQVSFKITKEDSKWDDSDIGYGSAATLTYGENVDVASMRGYSCVAYIDMNDDSDLVLKAIAPKAGRNKTLTLTKKQVESASIADGEISYFKNDSNDDKALKVKLDSNFVAYQNLSTIPMEDADFETLFSAEDAEFTTIKLIENSNDNKYDLAIVEKYDSFVVDSVNERSNTILANTSGAYRTFNGSRLKLDPDDDTITYSIKDKDGKEITLADIKKDNVANIATSEDGSDTFYDVIITDTVVSGTIAEKSTNDGIDYYKIGDAEYKVTPKNTVSVNVGDEGAFIVDMSGNILYKTAIEGGATGDFAFIIGTEAKKEFNSYTYRASIMNQKGEFSVLELATKVRINDDSQKEISFTGESGKVAYSTIQDMEKSLVGYKTNSSGQISQLYTDFSKMDSSYASVSDRTGVQFKEDGRIGNYFINADQSLFNADVADIADAKKDDMSMVSASGLNEDETYDFVTIVYNTNDSSVVAALGLGIKSIAASDAPAMVVTSVGTKNDSNGDPATLLKGYVNAESVDIVIPDDAKIQDIEKNDLTGHIFAKGDVIQYSADSNGEASGIRVLFTADQILDVYDGTYDDDNDEETPAVDYIRGDINNQDDGFFVYADTVAKIAGRAVYFVDPSNRDGESYAAVTLAGSVPSVTVTLNSNGDIRSINGDSAYSDVNTDQASPKDDDGNYPNTDKLFVVMYENAPVITVVVTDGNY